jgi:hypothetical protein
MKFKYYYSMTNKLQHTWTSLYLVNNIREREKAPSKKGGVGAVRIRVKDISIIHSCVFAILEDIS